MKDGLKTTEFWIGAIAAVMAIVQQQLFPNSPFPQAEFTTLGLWIAARLGEKVLTEGAPEKRAWQTTEFWAAIGITVAKQFVEIPESLMNLINLYIVGRPAAKVAQDISLKGLLGNKSEPITPKE